MNMTCTSASSRRQIRGMLSMLRREGRLPAGEDSDELDGREAEVDSIKDEIESGVTMQIDAEGGTRTPSRHTPPGDDEQAPDSAPPAFSAAAPSLPAAASGDSESAEISAEIWNGASGSGGVSESGGAAASELPCTPLSPTGTFAFDVEDLLKIVSVARIRNGNVGHGKVELDEVLNSPRGCPLITIAASPPTRGPLEALWMIDPLMLPEEGGEGEEGDEDAAELDEAWGEDGGMVGSPAAEVRLRLAGGGLFVCGKSKGGSGSAKKGSSSGSGSKRQGGSTVAPRPGRSARMAKRAGEALAEGIGGDLTAGASIGSSANSEFARSGSLNPPVRIGSTSCAASTASSNSPPGLSRAVSPPPPLPDLSPLPGPTRVLLPLPADLPSYVAHASADRLSSVASPLLAAAPPLGAASSSAGVSSGAAGTSDEAEGKLVLSPSGSVTWRPKAAEGLRLSRACLDGSSDGPSFVKQVEATKAVLPSAGSCGLGSCGLGSNALLMGGGTLASAGASQPHSACAHPMITTGSVASVTGSAELGCGSGGDISTFMNGWVDVDEFSSSPAVAAAAAVHATRRADQVAGPSPALLEDVESSTTLLSDPRRSSRMTARTTSC